MLFLVDDYIPLDWLRFFLLKIILFRQRRPSSNSQRCFLGMTHDVDLPMSWICLFIFSDVYMVGNAVQRNLEKARSQVRVETDFGRILDSGSRPQGRPSKVRALISLSFVIFYFASFFFKFWLFYGFQGCFWESNSLYVSF